MEPPAALGKVMVISPHLDDAVFGCGALLAAYPGGIVVTVFAGAPMHYRALTEWDAAAGFSAGQDIMAARREEDRRALAMVGALPLWFDYCDGQYQRPPPAQVLAAALESALAGHEPDTVAVLAARVLVGPTEREDVVCAAMAASSLPSTGLPGRSVLGFLAGASVVRRSAFLSVGGYEPRFLLGGEEALLGLDLAAQGWALVYADELTVYHYPSPRRDAVGRRQLLARNSIWVAWLRRPFISAIGETLYALRAAHAEGVISGCCIEAARGLPWVLRNRRVVPAGVEAMRRQIK